MVAGTPHEPGIDHGLQSESTSLTKAQSSRLAALATARVHARSNAAAPSVLASMANLHATHTSSDETAHDEFFSRLADDLFANADLAI